jgi:hypothetical protein
LSCAELNPEEAAMIYFRDNDGRSNVLTSTMLKMSRKDEATRLSNTVKIVISNI